MRHLPVVGHIPASPFVTRYMVIKQNNVDGQCLCG